MEWHADYLSGIKGNGTESEAESTKLLIIPYRALGNYTVICPESDTIISVYCFLPGGSGLSPICRIYGHLKRHLLRSFPRIITSTRIIIML